MIQETLLKLAERADILEEIELLIKQRAWSQAQEEVRKIGEALAQSMGKDGRSLPYSFAVMLSLKSTSSLAEKELHALQMLFQSLATAHMR